LQRVRCGGDIRPRYYIDRGIVVINKRTHIYANGERVDYSSITYRIVTTYGGIDVNAIAVAQTQTATLQIICYSYSDLFHTSVVNDGGYLYDTTNHYTLHDAIEQFNERVRFNNHNRVIFYGYEYNPVNHLLPNECIINIELNSGALNRLRLDMVDDTNTVIDYIYIDNAFVNSDSVAVRLRIPDLRLFKHTEYVAGAFGSGRYEYIKRGVHTDNLRGE
jgi:hypothetical protein